MPDLRIDELGKSIKGGDYQVEKAVEISIGLEEDGYTVWFQGWPVGKLDTRAAKASSSKAIRRRSTMCRFGWRPGRR